MLCSVNTSESLTLLPSKSNKLGHMYGGFFAVLLNPAEYDELPITSFISLRISGGNVVGSISWFLSCTSVLTVPSVYLLIPLTVPVTLAYISTPVSKCQIHLCISLNNTLYL